MSPKWFRAVALSILLIAGGLTIWVFKDPHVWPVLRIWFYLVELSPLLLVLYMTQIKYWRSHARDQIKTGTKNEEAN